MGGSSSKDKTKQQQPPPQKNTPQQPFVVVSPPLPPLPDFFQPFSDTIVRTIFIYANRSTLRQVSRCQTNRLALLSLMEISSRDNIAEECSKRSDIFKTYVASDSLGRAFTPTQETGVQENTLRKICKQSEFTGFSEHSAEYLTTLNALAHSLLKARIQPTSLIGINEDHSYDQIVVLVGYAYGRLIGLHNNVSALSLAGAGVHHQAHAAALKAVDIATGDWSTFLVQSCPLETQNRDATAILPYLEHRRLECGEQLDVVLSDAHLKWHNMNVQGGEEEQRKSSVCMLQHPKESMWYDIGYFIVCNVWQALYIHLEDLLTVGTTKYQMLNDSIVSKIVGITHATKRETESKGKQRSKTRKNTAVETKHNVAPSTGSEKEEVCSSPDAVTAATAATAATVDASVDAPVDAPVDATPTLAAPTPPHSPRSNQRLKELMALDATVDTVSIMVDQIRNGLEYELQAKHELYAEHDALLQSTKNISFVPYRKEVAKFRYIDWVDSLAQMYGKLERLQCTKVDAIITADLNSGKTTAKLKRKQLTKNIAALLDNIIALRKKIDSEKKKEIMKAGVPW
jgi:hypothetical protein